MIIKREWVFILFIIFIILIVLPIGSSQPSVKLAQDTNITKIIERPYVKLELPNAANITIGTTFANESDPIVEGRSNHFLLSQSINGNLTINKTLHLSNNYGYSLEYPTAIGTGLPTWYLWDVGGGGAGGRDDGGILYARFDDLNNVDNNIYNIFLFDMGRNTFFAGITNRFCMRASSDTGVPGDVCVYPHPTTSTITSTGALELNPTGALTFLGSSSNFNTNVDYGSISFNSNSRPIKIYFKNQDSTGRQFISGNNYVNGRTGSITMGGSITTGNEMPYDYLLGIGARYTYQAGQRKEVNSSYSFLKIFNTQTSYILNNTDTFASAWIKEPNVILSTLPAKTVNYTVGLLVEGGNTEGTLGNYNIWATNGTTRLAKLSVDNSLNLTTGNLTIMTRHNPSGSCVSGSVIFNDSHMSYCNSTKGWIIFQGVNI